MKLLSVFIVGFVFCYCSSAVNQKGSEVQVESTDSLGIIQNSTVTTTPEREQHTVIPEEDMISVDVTAENVLVTITNSFPKELYYDAKFFFERFEKGHWQKMDYLKNYGIPSIEYILELGEKRTHSIPFTSFASAFSEANYRVIKEYYFADKLKSEQIKEFSIKKDHAANAQNNTAAQNSQIKTEEKNLSQADLLSVKVENKSITLVFTNIHDQPIYYDSYITFQKWNGSTWENVNFIDSYVFVSMEYILLHHEIRTHPFPFSSFATTLTKGRYRVIKNYYFKDKIGGEIIKDFIIPACNSLCLIFPTVVKRQDLIAQKPISYSVTNNTDNTFIAGDRFFLERRNNGGQWEKVKLEDGLVNDIGYKINPQTENSLIEMHTYFLRNLPNGDYRITKPAFDYPGKKKITLQAEFKVTD